MLEEFWALAGMTLFFVGVHYNLCKRGDNDLEEAAMLPFADDPEVGQRMEREIRRSHTGCGCEGPCSGECRYRWRIEM